MFICVCKGLDEKTLKEMVAQGTRTVSDVVASCGAGGDCGTCAFKINRFLKDELQGQDLEAPEEEPLKASNEG